MIYWLKRCFHFLGGVHLAIGLIAATAFMVIVGTLLESYTNSHLFAAEWTYHSPFFLGLLGLMFVNILFSALRRWPFQKRHIPFLITHLGLLMVIAGTMVKQQFGIQGHLSITEGSGNQALTIPHTYALKIERLNPPFATAAESILPISLQERQTYYPALFPTLKLKILGYAPHVQEYWETWIKGEKAHIGGISPFPIQDWSPEDSLPQGRLIPLSSLASSWFVLGLRTPHLEESLRAYYLENLMIRLTSKKDPDQRLELPLKLALENGLLFEEKKIHLDLNLNLASKDFANPSLQLSWKTPFHTEKSIFIALQGNHSLYLQHTESWTSSSPFQVDLIRSTPSLLLIENPQKDNFLVAFDRYGRVHFEAFKQKQFATLIAYAQGHGGYAVQAEIPFPFFETARADKEKADEYFFSTQLKQALVSHPILAPPLKLFQQTCQKLNLDFVDTLIEFLRLENQQSGLLFSSLTTASPPLQNFLSQLEWNEISKEEYRGCQWTYTLLEEIQKPLERGQDLIFILQERAWPGLSHLTTNNEQKETLLTRFIQQIFSVSRHLPESLQEENNLLTQASLLFIYLKAYDLDYYSLIQKPQLGEETYEHFYSNDSSLSTEKIILETPLTYYHQTKKSFTKKEDNRPALFLEVTENGKKQILSLAYDETAVGLKWPILNGQYLIRFQPQQLVLPYRLRLRQARQINYPHTQQAYSYEGDVLVTNHQGDQEALTLSMNKVYETWDGFRFYLAGMQTTVPNTANQVQIVVNQDPVKYILTYPGAWIVTIGTLLLFWFKKSRK